MTKKIIVIGILGFIIGMTSAGASENSLVQAETVAPNERFNCTFQGPIAIGKGAVPISCLVFGEFNNITPSVSNEEHTTVLCGGNILYSDGVFATFPTTNTTEIRSVMPGALLLTVRTLTPGVFTGPLPSLLRVPAFPDVVLAGVCHVGRFTGLPPGITASELE